MRQRTTVDELAAALSAARAKLDAFAERRRASKEAIKELEATVAAAKREVAAEAKSGTTARSRQGELRAELQQLGAALSSSKAELRESERTQRSQEALENLTRLFPGVHGRMLDVCKPAQRRYNTAVTIAMGKNMEAIVVEREATALECVKYLKEKKCAPETFIPLDTIRAKPVAERLRSLGGSKRPVVDVISASEKFEKAVAFAVGDALLCDSLDEARQLAYHSAGSERYKVVTLDGTLINKAGLMTGGSSSSDRARSSKWNHREYEQLKQRADVAARELAAIPSVHESEEAEALARQRLESAELKCKNAKADDQLTKSKEAAYKKELEAVATSHTAAEEKLRELEAGRTSLKQALAALTAERNAVEDEIFADFSSTLGVESVREYEEEVLVALKEVEARVLELQAHQAKLRSQLDFEKRKELPHALEKLRGVVAADLKALERKRAEHSKAEEATEEARKQCAEVEEELTSTRAEHEAKAAEVRALRRDLRLATEEEGKLRARVAQLEGNIVQQRSQRQHIFQRARLDEVPIPTLPAEAAGPQEEEQGGGGRGRKRGRGSSGGGATSGERTAAPGSSSSVLTSEIFSPSAPAGGAASSTDPPEVEASQSGSSTGGQSGALIEVEPPVRIDFSSVAAATDSDTEQRELADELERVGVELEGMAPNMKALEQFAAVQSRLQDIEGEFESSRSSARAVSQRFAAVQQQRYERFMAAFNHVANAIDKVYKDLTQVEGAPLGGSAYLTLEDPTEPYLHGIKYTAMPPAKRFRDMEQLSGGERTVAALALLFAIHEFRPSPFFVMDEIDAALDNVNVTRVAKYVRERADEGALQFVIISLKDNFYDKAHGLVGIYRDRRLSASRSVTLDLERLGGAPPLTQTATPIRA